MVFELRGGWGVKVNETIEAMRDQWKSMTSMAGMFVTTIFLGITIQPVWDKDEVRAFGEEGTTQGGYILLELALIGIFTFLIIWLARKNLELLIKGFIMFSLYFSLVYTVLPIYRLNHADCLEYPRECIFNSINFRFITYDNTYGDFLNGTL